MAIAKLNPSFESIKGNIGNLIYYNRMGKVCIRSRVIPRNPRTSAQQRNRATFADAVASWQSMSQEEKLLWKIKGAKRKNTGYNYYISEYMRHIIADRSIPAKGVQPVNSDSKKHVPKALLRTRSVSSPFRGASCSCGDTFNAVFTDS